MTITGLDHLYVSVSDLARSERFYDAVMRALDFRKGNDPIGGEPHAHYYNPHLQYTIRPARTATKHDSYAPGLHHVCFQVPDRAAVDEAHAKLRSLGVEATAPKLYPEYNPAYYATFFEDPDGLRLEIVARTPRRDEIARRWGELEGFMNPLAKLRAREAGERAQRPEAADAAGSEKAERYWRQFLASLPASRPRPERYLEAFRFGTRPEGARAIAELVLRGIKASTGSLLWSYEFDGKRLPRVGDLSIFTDATGHPLGVIETTEVRILPLDEVDARFAYEGGEDDRSLESWRRMYTSYVEGECRRIAREPSAKAPIVCERFRLVYREALAE